MPISCPAWVTPATGSSERNRSAALAPGASVTAAVDQTFEPQGQLLADLAALAGDLLIEHQLQRVEVRLSDLDGGVAEVAAGRHQAAQRLAEPRHQRVAEAAAL